MTHFNLEGSACLCFEFEWQGQRHSWWHPWGCLQWLPAQAGETNINNLLSICFGSKEFKINFKRFLKSKWYCAKVSETPPPSYEEALYRNSVRLPGLQVFYFSFPSSSSSSKIPFSVCIILDNLCYVPSCSFSRLFPGFVSFPLSKIPSPLIFSNFLFSSSSSISFLFWIIRRRPKPALWMWRWKTHLCPLSFQLQLQSKPHPISCPITRRSSICLLRIRQTI